MSNMGRSINLHGPSAPSDSAFLPTYANSEKLPPRQYFLRLVQTKRTLEDEIATYSDILRSHNADFSTQLIDDEGFPRADIDVGAIRTARARLVRLRNDLSCLDEALAKALEVALPASPSSSPSVERMESSNRPPAALAPFAVVNSVAEGSPAGDAGLRKGDRILRFGSVNAELPDCMQAVARLVGRYEDVRIPLVILRADSDEQMLLPLTPRTWRGRGLLGCHILPLS